MRILIRSFVLGFTLAGPTIADVLRLPATVLLQPVDGASRALLFTGELKERATPLGFRLAELQKRPEYRPVTGKKKK